MYRVYGRVAPQKPLCAAFPEAVGTDTNQGCEDEFGVVSENFRRTKEKQVERTGVILPPVRSQTPAVRAFPGN